MYFIFRIIKEFIFNLLSKNRVQKGKKLILVDSESFQESEIANIYQMPLTEADKREKRFVKFKDHFTFYNLITLTRFNRWPNYIATHEDILIYLYERYHLKDILYRFEYRLSEDKLNFCYFRLNEIKIILRNEKKKCCKNYLVRKFFGPTYQSHDHEPEFYNHKFLKCFSSYFSCKRIDCVIEPKDIDIVDSTKILGPIILIDTDSQIGDIDFSTVASQIGQIKKN